MATVQTVRAGETLEEAATRLKSYTRERLYLPFAYLLARLRLESGSIWPAIVSHAAWNAVIVSTFGAFTIGPMAGLWTGESGILTVLVTLVVVALLVRGTWKMRKTPSW